MLNSQERLVVLLGYLGGVRRLIRRAKSGRKAHSEVHNRSGGPPSSLGGVSRPSQRSGRHTRSSG